MKLKTLETAKYSIQTTISLLEILETNFTFPFSYNRSF